MAKKSKIVGKRSYTKVKDIKSSWRYLLYGVSCILLGSVILYACQDMKGKGEAITMFIAFGTASICTGLIFMGVYFRKPLTRGYEYIQNLLKRWNTPGKTKKR